MSKPKVRIGLPGYAKLLHSIIQRRGTKRELIDRGICGRTAIGHIVTAFHAMGLIHVAAWQHAPGTPYQPVYEYGHKADAPAPATRPSGEPVASVATPIKPPRIRPELLAFHTVFEALQAPSSLPDIVEECGLAWVTVKNLLTTLHDLRLIHIADWRQRKIGGGKREALYVWGRDQPDAPYPTITRAEKLRRYRRNRALRLSPLHFHHASGQDQCVQQTC